MGKTVIDYMTDLGYRQGDKLYSTIFGDDYVADTESGIVYKSLD